MPTYRILVEVLPKEVFGLASPNIDVIPGGQLPKFHFNSDSGEMFVTRPDDSSGERREDEAFALLFKIDSMRVEARDNLFECELNSDNSEKAAAEAVERLDPVIGLFFARLPGPHGSYRLKPLRIRQSNQERVRLPEGASKFTVYDNEQNRSTMIGAAQGYELLDDPYRLRLARATKYLAVGDGLISSVAAWDDEGLQLVVPLQFLQYWKCLTLIVGDPSKDKDHQIRPKSLGLGRQFFRARVSPLHDLRNSFDVAHVTDPNSPAVVTPEQALECRSVAVLALDGFLRARAREA